MSFFGVQLNAQVNRLMLEIRLQLSRNKFQPNLRTIFRSFIEFDSQNSRLIDEFRFEKALNKNGIFFKKYQLQVFLKAYRNQQGLINWQNFLSHLRQPMGPARRVLVQEIFDHIDEGKTGKISTQKLLSHFNVKQIEAFRSGRKTREQVQQIFLSMLSITDNEITRDEFISFYDDININFAHNDIFQRFVSQFWNYTPRKVEAARQQQIKAAIKSLRFKLIEKSQATKDQFLLKKLFAEFDVNGNSCLSPYDLDLMMKKLGVKAQPKTVEPVLSRLDQNKSGYIEYQEFKQFLFHDPYPI